MTRVELYTVTLRGKPFCLDRSQIEFDSPNYFTACFLGSFAESSAREIHLSRDPTLFAMIVNYLSGYTVLPIQPVEGMSEEAVLENLLRDALFYGLDDLVETLEKCRAGARFRKIEERIVKSHVMVLWPQGMGSRKGQFLIRLSETQAQAQCNAHPISPNAIPMLQSVGTALVNRLFKEQKIAAQSWTWAAFWTTNQQAGTRVDNDCAVLEVMEIKRD